MRNSLLALAGLLIHLNILAQTAQKIVLEPVGRYIYQAYNNRDAGTDHLLNATGLPDGKILITGMPALAVVDVSEMTLSGSQDYVSRNNQVGGRDVVVYNDEYIYVNYHQKEDKTNTFGFGVNQITDDEITSITKISETDVFFEKMKIYDDYLYVAAHDKGFRIYSLANPESPTLVGSLSEGFTDVFDMAKSGDSLFVADGAGGLKVVDISDISAPTLLYGETNTSALGTAQSIETRNGKVYVAASGAGVLVYEKGLLSSRTQYETGGCAEQLCWVGDYLAVSNFSGVHIFTCGEGTRIEQVGSEKTSRFGSKASIRTSFGVGSAGDSLLLVSCWTTTDCFKIVPESEATLPDITCSAQRIRFSYNGGTSEEYITNNGGAPLIITGISLDSDDFSSDLASQTIAVGDTVFFTITYTEGSEMTAAETLVISSNDPDEEDLPIQLLGKTSTLDPGEEMSGFTLESMYNNRETGTYEEGSFTLSENLGKVMWFAVFGTWCPACPSAEVDMQNTIIKEFENNPDVETYVINQVYSERDDKEWVNFWTSRWYQRAPILYDETGEVGSEIFEQLDVGNMPFGRGMIIDQEGKVAKAFFGYNPKLAIETIYSLLEDETLTSTIDYAYNNTDEIQIYPNPVKDKCTVSFGNEYAEVKVELYNMAGQKLFSQDFEYIQSATLNLSELDKGIYVAYIYFDHESQVKKVIKY